MDEEQADGMPAQTSITKYVAGAGIALGALGAGFLIFRAWQKYRARREFEELKRRAIAGEIPAMTLINEVMSNGVTPDGKKTLKVADQRLLCSVVFPFTPAEIAAIPNMAESLAELRRNGTCI